MRPPGRAPTQWFHIAIVGFLIQAVYFGLCYLAFNAGVIAAPSPSSSACSRSWSASPRPIRARAVGALRWIGLVLGLAGAAIVILAQSAIAAETDHSACSAPSAASSASPPAPCGKSVSAPASSDRFEHDPVCRGPCRARCLHASLIESLHVDWTSPEFLAALAYLVIGNSLISMTLLLAMIRAGEVVARLVPLLSGAARCRARWPGRSSAKRCRRCLARHGSRSGGVCDCEPQAGMR